MNPSGDKSSYIGRRFVCDGFFGTILYHGLVPPTKGIWFGVEWDQPGRGKHDGTHEGVKYFTTKHPSSGSFLRPEKVDLGITYTEGIIERYGFDGNLPDVIDESEMYIVGENKVMKEVEVVGVDKVGKMQNEFKNLKEICLSGMRINGADEKTSSLTPSVVELDLSNNLISSWDDLANIIKDFKKLTTLILSKNNMRISEQSYLEVFQTVKELSLNEMNYDWNQLLQCAERNWPNISLLQAVNNNIRTISVPPPTVFQQLENLDIESNLISGWQDILNLAHLPNLRTLNMSNCGIDHIYFPDVSPHQKTNCFVSLQVIGLNDNKCETWTDVAELNKLKNLTELRMRNNPVCESDTPQNIRQLFIAKIGSLKMLNREEIKAAERRGAEIDYLKKFGKIWLEIGGSNATQNSLPANFVKEHPRYLEIVNTYGAAEESELNIVNKKAVTTKLLSITIRSPMLSEDVLITKKLPSTITIQKLKGLIQRLLKIGYQNLKLSCKPQKMKNEGIEIPLQNDKKTLHDYSVEDGDTILVQW